MTRRPAVLAVAALLALGACTADNEPDRIILPTTITAPASTESTTTTTAGMAGNAGPGTCVTEAPAGNGNCTWVPETTAPTFAPPETTAVPTCAALGRFDIPEGDPAFNQALDIDGDGIACESPTTTTSPTQANVRSGSFCAPEGGTGLTAAGTPMVCSTEPGSDRARWRAA